MAKGNIELVIASPAMAYNEVQTVQCKECMVVVKAYFPSKAQYFHQFKEVGQKGFWHCYAMFAYGNLWILLCWEKISFEVDASSHNSEHS